MKTIKEIILERKVKALQQKLKHKEVLINAYSKEAEILRNREKYFKNKSYRLQSKLK